MDYDVWTGTPRTLCDVLREMRSLFQTYNFSSMLGLIEECQMLANRMEAHLTNEQTYERQRENIKKAKNELLELTKEIEKLKGEKNG